MERILVIQTAFIGDAILTLPMIQQLKEQYPQSIIDVVAIPSTSEIFSSSPCINLVHILDKRGVHKNLKAFLKFSRMIRKNNYSRVYSPHRSFRSSLLVLLSGVKETFGFDKNTLRQVYRHHAKYTDAFHEVQRNLSLIGYNISNDNWKILPQVEIPENSKKIIDDFYAKINLNVKFVALAPGSVWNTKKYPNEYYIQLARHLINNGYSVLVIGGKDDIQTCAEIASADKAVISTAGKFSLLESVELLKRCSLLICNDSAPTHLGMCADIPVLTLYCSTIADFGFYPYNSKSSYLSYDDLYCKPCGIHGYNECPIKTFDCGYNLKPLQVQKKIEEMLNAN